MSRLLLCLMLLICVVQARAEEGRILATGGATQIEGAGGGGLVPWATILGYSAPGQIDADASFSAVRTGDFDLHAAAVGVGIGDRYEFSLARQRLSLDRSGIDQSIQMDIIGAKFKLAGDLIYGGWPQLSVGLQYKKQHDFFLAKDAGADKSSDVDVYLAATRLFLDGPGHRNWLVNATLRSTSANQLGLLGFDNRRHFMPEFSVAMLANPRWAIGAEYRFKPDSLRAAPEDDWWDGFVAWFPNKRFTMVLGYAALGDVAGLDDQNGLYLNLKWNP